MENPQMKANAQNVALGVTATLLVFAIGGGLFYLLKPAPVKESEFAKFEREQAELRKVYDEQAEAWSEDLHRKMEEARPAKEAAYDAWKKQADAESDARMKAMVEKSQAERSTP